MINPCYQLTSKSRVIAKLGHFDDGIEVMFGVRFRANTCTTGRVQSIDV